MDKVDKKIKTYGIILGVILFVLLIAGFTYANLAWNSKSIVISGKSNCLEVESVKGSNITGGNLLLQDETSIISNNQITIKNGMVITNVTAKIKSTCSISGYMTLNLNVTNLSSAFTSSGNSTGALKYVLASYNPSTYSTVSTTALNGKSFNIVATGSITSTGTIKLKEENLSKTETKAYLVIFYIDGDMANNDAGSNSTNFKSNLEAIVTQGEAPINAVKLITDLYTNATKTTTTVNSVTYNLASSVGLMNDRKGSMSTNIDAGNIRYYGANPNNYIYFNCSDYSNQTSSTCETWRIIGVFNDKIKIMRGSQIGTLAWDQDKNVDSSLTTYDNNWTTATLMELLNNKYYNGNTSGIVSYYSNSDGSTVSNLDMTSIGLKNDVTRNMIDTETWHLGGWFSALIDTAKMYEYENSTNIYTGRDLTWDGKIALVYPSDYGYAVDFNNCSQTLYNYNLIYCLKNNWMYNIITNNGNNVGWVLTPISNDGVSVWHVNSEGYMRNLHSSYLDSGVIPTLYLKQNIDISGGNGNSSSPYQLKIS